MTEQRLFDTVELDAGQLRRLLEPYAVVPRRHTALKSGIINSNFRVDTDTGPYLLRIYNGTRLRPEIEFEMSLLQRLAEMGVPAQKPLASPIGPIGHWHDRFYALLTFIEGDVLEEGDLAPDVSQAVGLGLGAIHNALDGLAPIGSKPRADIEFIDDLMRDAMAVVAQGDGHAAVRQLQDLWHEARAPFAPDALPLGVVHADVCPNNVVFNNGRFAAIIDFDDAYLGTQLFDVAIAAMEFGWQEDGEPAPTLMAAFLRGYRATRDIVGLDRIVDAMWANCFRFFCYTLPLTLGEGKSVTANPYAQRAVRLADWSLRQRLQEAAVSHGAAESSRDD